MIHSTSFTQDHLGSIRTDFPVDNSILERTIFALALLEALARVGLPFIFKGGTSLLLLLDTSRRLSTDIDIIVKPDTDVQYYLDQAAAIYPFISVEQQHRKGKNNIEKSHYKFTYDSSSQNTRFFIFLDILYEENHYSTLIKRKIAHQFLKTEPPYFFVTIPSINCILGDKLTAFAPHTSGILLGEGRETGIIKQMYDAATLIDAHDDFGDVYSSYNAMVTTELNYRGIVEPVEAVLHDTIEAAACIASRGRYLNEDYPNYLMGIRAIKHHIYGERFNAEKAVLPASKVMYMATCIWKRTKFEKIINAENYMHADIGQSKYAKLSALRKLNIEAFSYVVKAIQTLHEE